MEPEWLAGGDGYRGTVDRFIPGQNEKPAMVVRLDRPVTLKETTGQYLVLELRYTGAIWKNGETVHVELCAVDPEDKSWHERGRGVWVESNATVRAI